MEKIRFNLSTEEATRQLQRLLDLSFLDSDQKKLSVLYKSINLFAVKKEKCISYFLNMYNLSDNGLIKKYNDTNGSDTLKYDNFYFVRKEIKEEDLQYKDNKYLTYEEVQFYLFRLTLKLTESFGSQKLARNYFLSFSDSYLKQTSRKINKDKIGYMNKLLQKYKYIYTDSQNTFYIASCHPLFDTSVVSQDTRQKSILGHSGKNYDTTGTKYQNLKQDYNNLILQYQCLLKQYEALERRYNNFFKPCLN